MLREAARRIGVSANAAYRHFGSLPDLVDAVALDALAAPARAMETELSTCQSTGDAEAPVPKYQLVVALLRGRRIGDSNP